MALTEAAYYDFFRKIVLQPDGVTLEADHTRDELTITRGAGVAFNPVEGTDSFEIDVDYSLYVPIGSTSVTLRDVNANESNISITAGSNIVVSRVSDNELEIIATVGGASKSISNISATNPVVVTTTSSHSYTEGSEVTITDVIGMTEVNGNEYYMDILTGDTFALYSDPLLTTPIDGTLFTPYSTGGVATADYTAVKTMSGLTDTTITTPQNNDLIAYSGGMWVNTNSITATLTGDVTGNVTGDVTGDVTGNVTGDVTGNLDGIVGGTTPAAGTFTELRTSENSIALGNLAGSTSQGATGVTVGYAAGETSQGTASVAIGNSAGRDTQSTQSVAIGQDAARNTQGQRAVAIGYGAGRDSQTQYGIAIGYAAGQVNQDNAAVALGAGAGFTGQGNSAVAIGGDAGPNNQAANSIVINATGSALENTTASSFVVKPVRQTDGPYYLKYDDTSGEVTYASASDFVVGDLQGSVFADDSTTLVDAVNGVIPTSVLSGTVTNDISTSSLRTSELAIRLGNTAASISPGTYGIAIGDGAGENTQGNYSIAIGKDSGQLGQLGAVAIGYQAAQAYQKNLSVAVGNATGNSYQGFYATAVGSFAANNSQSDKAVALGHYAGEDTQGESAIAVGAFAGTLNQAANSIIINATGSALQNTTASSFVVKPIRAAAGTSLLNYDGTSGEITYVGNSTDNVSEGSTNLYYTDARAQTATTGRAIAMSMIFGG